MGEGDLANFDKILLESIDEAVEEIFSKQVVAALHLNLMNKRNIAREELPNQLPTLSVVFATYFGRGARTLERTIARRLYSRLGIEFHGDEGFGLTDYVALAKRARPV